MKRFVCILFVLILTANGYGQLSFGFTYQLYSHGIEVLHVFKNSPAEKAGLKPGDIITHINDTALRLLDKEKKTAALLNSPVNCVFRIGIESPEDGELYSSRSIKIMKEDKNNYLNKCLDGNCKNGTGKHLDGEGATYTGSFKNGKREGRGKLTTMNGQTYEGDWKANKKEGKGMLIFQPAPNVLLYHYYRYEGEWKNDSANGKCKIVNSDSSYYLGDVRANVRHGHGKFFLRDSTLYEGEWVNDTLSGMGFIQYTSGDMHTGNFINGKLEGEVTIYTKATNTIASVMFKNGIKQ